MDYGLFILLCPTGNPGLVEMEESVSVHYTSFQLEASLQSRTTCPP